MIERDDETELARVLSPLRDGPIALSGRDDEAQLRAKVVPQMRAQLEALHVQRSVRARRRRVIAIGAALTTTAIAAASLLMIEPAPASLHDSQHSGLRHDSSHSGLRIEGISNSTEQGAAWIDDAGEEHAIGREGLGALLPLGALELRARGSSARLRTAQGAEVELSPQTRLGVRTARSGSEPQLRLLAGEVACAVPKLGPNKQFAIETPSARVVVHGTRFSVRVRDGQAQTCVRVQEGLVAVHHGAETEWLKPGMQWGCEELDTRTAVTTTVPDAAPSARPEASARSTARPNKARVAKKAAAGTLDAENRLLAEALSAERTHDTRRAHDLFRTLLNRHPDSPLATEAAAGLQRTR